jgi:hypothetical protein
MHPFHIAISAALLVSAIGLFVGLEFNQPGIVSAGVMAGWLFSVAAVFVMFVLVIVFIIRAANGNARTLFNKSWLGVLNGIAAVRVFWWLVMPHTPSNLSLRDGPSASGRLLG